MAVDADSVLGFIHAMDVGHVAYVTEMHGASIVRVDCPGTELSSRELRFWNEDPEA